MDSYTFALVLGGAGLVAMAATGLAHSGSHSGPPATGHAGAGHGSGQAQGHAQASHSAASHAQGRGAGGVRSALLSLASPRVLFSLLVGFGLTGVVGRPFVSGVLLAAIAVAGGIAFERALVAPLWRALFKFASNPASTLESSLMGEARAASGFDGNGQGLVAVEVDGQVVQCLGTLRADDMALGVHVHAGDLLRVEDVDATRNRCTVSFVERGGLS